jgi:phosphatidylglycerophosphate synthase
VAEEYAARGHTSALVLVAALALFTDAVDGRVARRTGTSAFGARYDGEVDALLILVLSVHVAGSVGAWVLAIGVMRYAFAVAGWLQPWLREPLGPRHWRKVVAAAQGIMLTVAASGLVPAPWSALLVAAALGLLVESFGRDVAWLWRGRPDARRPGRHGGTAGARVVRPGSGSGPPVGVPARGVHRPGELPAAW